jgi:hypothetical protein
MNEQEFEELLKALLEGEPVQFQAPDVEPEYAVDSVSTLEELGLSTSNRGLVVRVGDGSEYQITIERRD